VGFELARQYSPQRSERLTRISITDVISDVAHGYLKQTIKHADVINYYR
jgi:hypothetical protein